MTDVVDHAVGRGPAGALARRAFVLRDVEAIFGHRARVIPGMLAAHGVRCRASTRTACADTRAPRL